MSRPYAPDPVLLVMGVLHQPEFDLLPVTRRLERNFGPMQQMTEPINFRFTDYYEKEMGARLQRRFLMFTQLIDPARLPKIKLATNVIESDFAGPNGKRRINLDPGYLNAAHLILATGKNYAHRPYLGHGIFADLTLMWQDKRYQNLPWTYPDYADASTHEVLTEFRRYYLDAVREQKGALVSL
ncbi:MAG TPA: DUF4416 family protein [bacterium]|nr:DUF4416 family protein [bacterium]